jgi:hypothetical protein
LGIFLSLEDFLGSLFGFVGNSRIVEGTVE